MSATVSPLAPKKYPKMPAIEGVRIATDAPIAAPVLQDLLSRGVGKTFNAVTVDSDTSTSDTLLLFATGAAARRGASQCRLPIPRW
jgi:N-acetylglutamate synthase/N-acetylornithine aminotransferase